MKILKVVLLFIAVYGLFFSLAHATGDAAKGKALFNDPKFAGATTGKSCNSCHPDGKGLDKAGDKHEFKIMGHTQKSLEEAVNSCIEGAIKGKALDLSSVQMKDMVAYIKSLKKHTE
ncbi:MAG: hypothetical protein HZB61_13910 [Nitrospirae bacterium]|nr:hypothetical protein [Nitrospirota bacterium]